MISQISQIFQIMEGIECNISDNQYTLIIDSQ